MKLLDSFSFQNQRFLIRVDYNVPMDSDLNITDDTRMRATLPTINKIISSGGSVVLMSHRGRPKGLDDSLSMRHLVSRLSDLLSQEVKFIDHCIGDKVTKTSKSLKSGEVLLVENLRFHDEDTAGDIDFAKQLSFHLRFVKQAFQILLILVCHILKDYKAFLFQKSLDFVFYLEYS